MKVYITVGVNKVPPSIFFNHFVYNKTSGRNGLMFPFPWSDQCTALWKPVSVVFVQLKDPLELLMKAMECIHGCGFLSLCDLSC